MQNHLAECRIGRMAMGFPGGGIGIKLQRPGFDHPIDFHRRLEKIRAGTAVPLAELDDAHRSSVGAAEHPSKGAAKPECLQFQLGGQGGHHTFLER